MSIGSTQERSPDQQGYLSRSWYHAPIPEFISVKAETVLGELTRASAMPIDLNQRDAWLEEIDILHSQLRELSGHIHFEFSVPRVGSRVDVILVIACQVFVIEFKVGARSFERSARDQVWDYALDLKNFHEASHALSIVPVLIATRAENLPKTVPDFAFDGVAQPLLVGTSGLRSAIDEVIQRKLAAEVRISDHWAESPYRPTPTIIEAARALFANHSVEAIARHDAAARNLRTTSRRIEQLVAEARHESKKIICFVTGVPGAGKTLVGLNVATRHQRKNADVHAVYLSGNGPLVAVLREALTRDEVARLKRAGERMSRKRAAQPVKAFIQNVHHFRDEALSSNLPPDDHVVVFDEAQRAWNREKTAQFMKQKKGRAGFAQSEAAFLISYLDRHTDWAVIICLIGGGQEIHTGEAGISAWIDAARTDFPQWNLHISGRLTDPEYAAARSLGSTSDNSRVRWEEDLHLAVSMRSFRAEHLSGFIRAALDSDLKLASDLLEELHTRYPITITRDLLRAKQWLRRHARGTERYGLIASSKAMRLKPHAIDVRVAVDPVHWFLDGPDDVRSSWYLEDCATEFQVQGLELDWACVTWDADLRYSETGWKFHDFRGNRWLNIKSEEHRNHLKNAYRVLLTRARQGMVVFVPPGDVQDETRLPEYYDHTFSYLKQLGLQEV